MIAQYFEIGEREWSVVVYYDVWPHNLSNLEEDLYNAGSSEISIEDALNELSKLNTGYTFTNYDKRMSVVVISHATSAEQLFDTYDHELKHLVEHISNYFGVNPKSEEAAYLQGEIARKMFPALAMVVCPNCNGNYRRNIRVV